MWRNLGLVWARKRALDRAAAFIALACLVWPMFIIAMLVRINLGSPVLFRQMRRGFRVKPFVMYKFCGMTDERDADGRFRPNKIRLNKIRLTHLGAWLRAWNVDELRKLFNVLKRDLILVGRRRLVMEYLDRYSPEQFRRHEGKPGITG